MPQTMKIEYSFQKLELYIPAILTWQSNGHHWEICYGLQACGWCRQKKKQKKNSEEDCSKKAKCPNCLHLPGGASPFSRVCREEKKGQ